MLSAILGDNLARSFGVAGLEEQTPHERAYSPLPQPDGTLIHDPDFSLPTIAGPLVWRLFHYSSLPNNAGCFGNGRRASFPMRLCADVTGTTPAGYIVTVNMEREDGRSVQYIGNSPPDAGFPATYVANSPRLFDNLVNNVGTDQSWDETRFDTGATFHYPAGTGMPCSLAYYQTVQGQYMTMNYDTDKGTLTSIMEPAGRELLYNYTGPYCTSIQDWAGRITTFYYSSANDMVQMVDPTGASTYFQCDVNHNLTLITDPNNWDTAYQYDDNSRVTMRSVNGNTGYYSYSGGTTTYLDPNGETWTTVQDSDGNVTSVTDPVSATRQAIYTNDLPTTIIDAIGRITTMAYNSNGQKTSHQNPANETDVFNYDGYGNLIYHEDPTGNPHYYNFAGDGSTRQMISEQNALGYSTQYAYTDWGAIQAVATPMGFITTYSWSNYGELLSEQNALGYFKYHEYDLASNRVLDIDEMGRLWTYAFDQCGRQTSVENGEGAVWQTFYDGTGKVNLKIDPIGNQTAYWNNEYGMEYLRLDANSQYWYTNYDACGRESSRLDPMGSYTQTVHDVAARLVQHIDGMGRITENVFDDARQPIGIIYPSGATEQMLFDGASRVVGQVGTAGQITTYFYDGAGNTTAVQKPSAVIYTYLYDALNRNYGAQEPTGGIRYSLFDMDGRPISRTDQLGFITTMVHDAAGRVTSIQLPGDRRYTNQYDPSGSLVQENSPDGTFKVRYYDGAGRPVGTLDHLGLITTTTLDLANQVKVFTDVRSNSHIDSYTPTKLIDGHVDPIGNIYTLTHDNAMRPQLYQDTLGRYNAVTFDSSNSPTSHNDRGNLHVYNYDVFGRHQSTQDILGNLTTRGYDAYDRFVSHWDETGVGTTRIYDQFNRPAAIQNGYGWITTTNFDAFSRVIGTTDARGYQDTTLLDLLHRKIGHIDALGNQHTLVYNGIGKLDHVVDPLGWTTNHFYDGAGNRLATLDPAGGRVSTVFDEFSRPYQFHNQLGSISSLTYTGYGDVGATYDPMGGSLITVYDEFGRVSQSIDQATNITTTKYDDVGRYSGYLNSQGYAVTTLYDSLNRPYIDIDQIGAQTQYSYDQFHRVQMTQDSMSQTTIQLFDSRGNRAITIDALSRPVTRTHDALNRLSTQVDLTGDGSVYQYDPVSNLAMEVDATGQVFTYYWDGLSRMTGSLDPTGALSQAVYDRRSSRIATIDAQGRTVTTVYDSLQRPIASINPLGFVYTTVYDAASRVIAQVNPRGYAVSMFYDNLDRQIGTEDQLGYRTSVVFDSRSNVIADVDQLNYRTTYTLDTLNRRLSTLSPLGYYHTTVYDPRSLAIAGITPLGLIHTTVFDSLQRAIAQITPDAAIWTTIYDPVSNPLAVQTPLNQRTTQVYDARNRVVNTIDPLNRITTTTWDILNRVLTAQDQKGQITSHQWDPRSLEINRIYADGTQLTFLYDSLRQLTGVSDHIGLYTMGYDLLDRMLSVNAPGHPNGLPISFGYDENSNRTQMATPWGLFSYGFDPRDQMQVMTDPGYPSASVMGGRTTWTYDPRMLCIRQDNVNLTRTTTTYDADRRLTQQWHYTAANVVIDHVTMTYDANDRPTGKGQFAGVSLFGYDACDRLITEFDPINGRSTLTYDLVGRRVTMTNSTGAYGYQYDFADQMLLQTTPTGSVSYTHDTNGSLTVATKPTSRTTYTWDAANRMSSARLPSGQIYTQLYQYDDMRIAESAPTGITTFIWNPGGSGTGQGDSGLPEVLGIVNRQVGGTMEQIFASGYSGGTSGATIPLSQPGTGGWERAGVRAGSLVRALGTHADSSTINRQYHTDNQATVQATTTGSASIEADFHTDSWGNIISGTAADNPYVYQGGLGYWEDTNLTLKYVRARWMDPATGQWLSVDPVRSEPRYQYAHNSPAWNVDPSGMGNWLEDEIESGFKWIMHEFGASDSDAQRIWSVISQLGGDLWQVVTGIKAKFEEWGDQLTAAFHHFAQFMSASLHNMLPRPGDSMAPWIGGMVVGLIIGLAPLALLLIPAALAAIGSAALTGGVTAFLLIGGLVGFAIALLTSHSVLQMLIDFLIGDVREQIDYADHHPEMSNFDRGKTFGHFVGAMVAAIVNVVATGKGLSHAFKNMGGVTGILATLEAFVRNPRQYLEEVIQSAREAGAKIGSLKSTIKEEIANFRERRGLPPGTVTEKVNPEDLHNRVSDTPNQVEPALTPEELQAWKLRFDRGKLHGIWLRTGGTDAELDELIALRQQMIDEINANLDKLKELSGSNTGRTGSDRTRGLLKYIDRVTHGKGWQHINFDSNSGLGGITREAEIRPNNAELERINNSINNPNAKPSPVVKGTKFADSVYIKDEGGAQRGILPQTVDAVTDKNVPGGIRPSAREGRNAQAIYEAQLWLKDNPHVSGVRDWSVVTVPKPKFPKGTK